VRVKILYSQRDRYRYQARPLLPDSLGISYGLFGDELFPLSDEMNEVLVF